MQSPAVSFGSKNTTSGAFFAATKGRPPGADPSSERTLKPWLALGVSERTYYRRKTLIAAAAPKPPEQHAAHVVDWCRGLTALQRLEYRALARRCVKTISSTTARASILELYMTALGVN